MLEGPADSGPKRLTANTWRVGKEIIVRRVEAGGTARRVGRLDTVHNSRQLIVAGGRGQTAETPAARANVMGSLVWVKHFNFVSLGGD